MNTLKKAKKDHRKESALAHQISNLAFFKGMQKDHLNKLAEHATRVGFSPNERIFQAGDPANRFYLVEIGDVQVETPDPSCLTGLSLPIQSVGPGDVLGWSWLYHPYEWNLNAWATEPTEAIVFYATPLRAELEQDPILSNEIYQRIARVMVGRLRHMRTELVSAHRGRMLPGSGVLHSDLW